MASGTDLVKSDERGLVQRESFGLSEKSSSAETAVAAVQARETARIQSAYVMAERHPRSWDDVRVRLLAHCDRPGFAEVAWYKKPAGRKKINTQWVETFAEGLSARFAEVARQEMGNVSTETTIVYEDHLSRIIRATTVDLQNNAIDSREFTIPKFVEKRGEKKGENWEPPKGREVVSQRINSYGEPSYLVVATDDEIRSKMNSEISKTTRDESLRLIPKDIRDDCAAKIAATKADPKKTDPTAAKKKLLDGFAALNVMPSDLRFYMGTDPEKLSPAEIDELRGLYQSIRDGDISWNEAARLKIDTPKEGENETDAQRDIRIERQGREQTARRKQEQEQEKPKESAAKTPPSVATEAAAGATISSDEPAALTPEENKALDAKLAEEEKQPAKGTTRKFGFGKGKAN